MKTTLFLLTTLTALSEAATFTTVDIATLELSQTDTSTNTASVVDTIANTVTTSYSYSSDYDGLGGNDTLSFDVVATFTGSTSGAQIGVTNNAVNYVISPGQTITYTLMNLNYTRANGLSSSALVNGFYEISVGGSVVGDFTSNASRGSYTGITGTGNSITFNMPHPVLDLTLDPLATGDKFFRRPDARFTLETTIPEPGSIGLLALGSLTLLARRQR